MRSRYIWTSLAVVVIASLAFAAGLFFSQGRPAIARVANRLSCASSKQFIVELRIQRQTVLVEVDGKPLGRLSPEAPSIRWFLCEGNHEARLIFLNENEQEPLEEHRIDFAVSRPSLFHVVEWSPLKLEPKTCVSVEPVCERNIGLELAAFGPDDPKAIETARLIQP